MNGRCSGGRVRAALWRWRKTELVIAVVIALLVIAANLRPPCLWSYLVLKRYPKLTAGDRTDVTLVTAYFNLGRLEVSGSSLSTYKYLHWAQAFQYVQNPLVVYTDSEQIENMLQETRRHLANRTRVFRVSRSSLRAFRDVNRVRALFQDPAYPKFHPNTIIPEYPCSQHAKYELMKRTLDQGLFAQTTRYIAWVDIGYFRYITKRGHPFYVIAPPDLDESKVAMTQVDSPDWSLHPVDVFHNNLVWVGGGMSLAARPVYARFAEEYLNSTESFLRQGLSNTDQQVLYAMFTPAHRAMASRKPTSSIQTYSWPLNDLRQCWYYLGFLCYREVE